MSCRTIDDIYEDEQEAEVTVELRPFKHQVGGHTCVLEVGRDVICKPLIDREQKFYTRAPESLRRFIPRYLGETYVTCDITQSRKCLVAKVSRDLVSPGEITDQSNQSRFEEFMTAKRRKRHKSSENEAPTLAAWSNSCIERQITRYGFWANNQPQKFIMLENLVKDYKRPCLMDLKMGRRQFGTDSDAEKRKLLERRCASSTSATLGFRICGSQSYQKTSDSYTFHDKYHGRSLDDTGAIEELRLFFHNGTELRTDIILALFNKLTEIEAALLKEKDLDLHSASLLLIYEGHMASGSRTRIRIGNDCQCSGAACSKVCAHEGDVKPADTTGWPCTDSGICPHLETIESPEIQEQISSSSKRPDIEEPCLSECKVDVRLIDFAHASESLKGSGENPIVFGLKRLQVILQDYFSQNTCTM